MNNSTIIAHGIKLLVEKCRNENQRPEKMDYYTRDRYKEAEKKIIKLCLRNDSDH